MPIQIRHAKRGSLATSSCIVNDKIKNKTSALLESKELELGYRAKFVQSKSVSFLSAKITFLHFESTKGLIMFCENRRIYFSRDGPEVLA